MWNNLQHFWNIYILIYNNGEKINFIVVDKKEEKEVEDDVESIDKKLRKFEDDKEDVVIGSKKINPLKAADKLPVTKRGTGGKRTPYKFGDKK